MKSLSCASIGPILFNIYIRSLYSTAKGLKFSIHGYADDHQVYKSFSKADEYSIMTSDVPECFDQISQWMIQHFLQINPGKTEIVVFGSPSVLKSLIINGVFLKCGTCVRFSPVAKNLGFLLDSQLSFRNHVCKLKCALFGKLRSIRRMKPFLTEFQVKILVQGIVLSSLDFCNSLYYGCNQKVLHQLQTIQNSACRVIFGLKKTDSVKEKMKQLHWLQIQQRIEFKIILFVFKSIHSSAPSYLSELFYPVNINEKRAPTLRINNTHSFNARAFQISGAKLWNNLPSKIREIYDIEKFKQNLKTHLFKASYNV